MYKRTVYAREVSKQKASEVKKQDAKKEMEPCTFSPRINGSQLKTKKKKGSKRVRYINLSSSKNKGLNMENRLTQFFVDKN